MPAEEKSRFGAGFLAGLRAGTGGMGRAEEGASPESQQSAAPQAAAGGGGVTLDHLMRRSITFRIFESDLQSLEQINRRALLLFSISGFFINIGLAIIIGVAFADPVAGLSEFGKFLFKYGSYTAFGVAVILFCFGVWEWLIKKSNVDKIYEEHGLKRSRSWRGVSISVLKKPEITDS